jgi:3-dehydroquinate synthase
VSGRTVRVANEAAREAAYDVVVGPGALRDLPQLLRSVLPARRCAVIAPADVARMHARAACDALRAAGLDAELFTFAPGEASKTRESWAALTDALLAARFGRDSCIVAIGGGVAGDLAGFVAATYMRGLPLVQVPTTLLAMVDASVGGKTGVDTAAGKNLVGAFHPPRLVVADPLVLATLPADELRAGLAEAVKHGVMLDASYFAWIADHVGDVLGRDAAAVEHLVARSVELKAAVVAEDPFEQGMRAVLNFGHTVAHALEQSADWSLAHGFAVAAGMVVEARAGEIAGVTDAGTAARVAALLRSCGLPDSPPQSRLAQLLPAMRLDKKARAAEPRFALPRRIGEPARDDAGSWTFPIGEDALETALAGAAREPRTV